VLNLELSADGEDAIPCVAATKGNGVPFTGLDSSQNVGQDELVSISSNAIAEGPFDVTWLSVADVDRQDAILSHAFAREQCHRAPAGRYARGDSRRE
jgi:hypothetical protein